MRVVPTLSEVWKAGNQEVRQQTLITMTTTRSLSLAFSVL